MRKIEQAMLNAIMSRTAFKQDNTEVRILGETIHVYLHSNLIATHEGAAWQFNFQGWVTPTTSSRIHAIRSQFKLPPVNIRKGVPYCDGKPVLENGWFK